MRVRGLLSAAKPRTGRNPSLQETSASAARLSLAKRGGLVTILGVNVRIVIAVVGVLFVFLVGGGIFALILFPILYAIIGFIAGAISAALYNLVAGIVGGIEIDVE